MYIYLGTSYTRVQQAVCAVHTLLALRLRTMHVLRYVYGVCNLANPPYQFRSRRDVYRRRCDRCWDGTHQLAEMGRGLK